MDQPQNQGTTVEIIKGVIYKGQNNSGSKPESEYKYNLIICICITVIHPLAHILRNSFMYNIAL